ncbi:MAG: hypothetical protein IT308_13665, partial [Anaerolineaceae bacterium]|nr:hypothetical protein [Anaerolineaceae bacterium]
MKKAPLLFWGLFLLAALATLAGIFTLPSGAEKSLVLGLSAQRLALALFPLACILFSLSMLWMIWAAPGRYAYVTDYVRRFSSGGVLLSGALSFWTALFLAGFLLVYRLAIAPPAADLTPKLGALFPALTAYLDRLWPVLIFLAFCLGGWTWYAAYVLIAPFFKNAGLLAACGAGVFS